MKTSIPVHVMNPGQVFACMGFLEAADALMGGAKGWLAEGRFYLEVPGEENPFAKVLEFLANATVEEQGVGADGVYPGPEEDGLVKPARLRAIRQNLALGHWADESSRGNFKLYAGNRSGYGIASDMVQKVKALWGKDKDALMKDPLNVLGAVGGSFNFDPRGAWTALDAGYSPNDTKHVLASSPVVEILAALGLEYARPFQYERRQVRYGVWTTPLPPFLARAALGGARLAGSLQTFHFELDLAGKNKVVTFAQAEVVS